MQTDPDVEAHIRSLEERLLDPRVRAAPEELAALLADDFFEFGSSGRIFDKHTIIRALQEESRFQASLHDFSARPLSPDCVLATYRSVARVMASGETRRSLRSSIWVRRLGRWQVTFHQGTVAT